MAKTKVTCPKCSAEFAIPETSSISTGVVIGKDSNLGEMHPALAEDTKPKKKASKAEQRLAALRAAGIDTSGLGALNMANGESILVRTADGAMEQITDDDPIFNAISKKGTIPDRSLFRRWVMSQMFHILAEIQDGNNKTTNMEDILRRKGVSYMWNVIVEEFRVQAKLAANDPENFRMRNNWFNHDTATIIIQEYLRNMESQLKKLPVKHCKKVPYVVVDGKNIFCDDLNKKVVMPMKRAAAAVEQARTPKDLYDALKSFNTIRKHTYKGKKLLSSFTAAYKGSGAYFTLKNMILFHGCALFENGKRLNRENSITLLDNYAFKYTYEGWEMYRILRQTISDNNLDIVKKMKEWKK